MNYFPNGNVRGVLLGLRQLLVTENSYKMMKNYFCFTLKSPFFLK